MYGNAIEVEESMTDFMEIFADGLDETKYSLTIKVRDNGKIFFMLFRCSCEIA